MRPINAIVIHCSATRAGQDIGRTQIDQWHRGRGWSGIGYHYVIRLNGTVEIGRDERVAGAHVAGHNAFSIGICVVGGLGPDGKSADTVTAQQAVALEQLLVELRARFPHTRICGHRDLSPDKNRNGVVERHEWLKDCPSFDVATWCRARNLNPEVTS